MDSSVEVTDCQSLGISSESGVDEVEFALKKVSLQESDTKSTTENVEEQDKWKVQEQDELKNISEYVSEDEVHNI